MGYISVCKTQISHICLVFDALLLHESIGTWATVCIP